VPPCPDIGFDESGSRVLATDFDFDAVDRNAEEHAADDESRLRQETLKRLLQFLCDRATDAAHVGRRATLLASMLKVDTAPQTCRALGKFLGVSGQRAHVLLTQTRKEMADLQGDC